ncbi:MAG: hypothetical protein IKZ49_02860 [Alphaproteobacteria bacterium]|nr:hypothetical protein [Alphaproteobacteria bacterium]
MRQELGRSMIEMVGVLAIMGLLTAGAFALISYGFGVEKNSRVTDNVTAIVTGIREHFGQYDDFSKLAELDNDTIFSAIHVNPKNPYGGTYEVVVDSSNPRQFIVKINGLNKSDCQSLSIKAWVDSVGYNKSNHKDGGATGVCTGQSNNSVFITYGE